jgi:hypothetical protein
MKEFEDARIELIKIDSDIITTSGQTVSTEDHQTEDGPGL